MTDVEALKRAKASAVSTSLATMYDSLHSSYRTFCLQVRRRQGSIGSTLAEISMYTLGTWTYEYEAQTTRTTNLASHTPGSTTEPILTLDDVLLEYLPPIHSHLPLLLGYTVSLLNEYREWIRPLLPSLILLTASVCKRAAIELAHSLFDVAGSGWGDFILCMTVSRLIGREDEYLAWLAENMGDECLVQYMGHFLRIPRDYASFTRVVQRTIEVGVTKKYDDQKEIDLSVRGETMRHDLEDMEAILSQLVQKVCVWALQSGSTNDLVKLYNTLSSDRAQLSSLNLLLHLTIQTLHPDYPSVSLVRLSKTHLNFSPLRAIFPPPVLKSHISRLLEIPGLSAMAVAIAQDWKEHIDYDDEDDEDPDHVESISDFLDRVEREYLSATEGVKWRFEDVLAEWIGEWPDGTQLGSSKIPRMRKTSWILSEQDVQEKEHGPEDEQEEEEEFAGSLVKRVVPRSGLIVETPVPQRAGTNGIDISERKGGAERLFRLTSIGQTEKQRPSNAIDLENNLEGESFMDRLGLEGKHGSIGGQVESCGILDARIVVEDDERNMESRQPRRSSRKARQKRRRFDDSESDSEEGSIYEESDVENIVPKTRKRRQCKSDSTPLTNFVNTSVEEEPSTSDVDELSISIEERAPRHALQNLMVNCRVSSSMVVRESSPINMADSSDDELGI